MSANEESYFDNYIEPNGGGSDSDDDDSSDTSSVASSVSEKDDDNDELVSVVSSANSDDDGDDDDSDDGGQKGGGEDQDYPDVPDYEEQVGEEEQRVSKSGKKIKKIPAKKIVKKAFSDDMNDDDDEDEDGEMYLKKFDREVNENYIVNNHPECAMQNYDEILAMTKVVRDTDNIIIDDLHKTNPFLTKYERARILGQRAKQIETGATPFVKVPENIIDGYLIAEMELQQGRIPFIIRRPLPNGGSEYWKIGDLENIAF
jgi:DNA-directed RNA polymerase I, II, and III subunit RPABC2